jgi:poly(3-hydroxybutyrate) depolymerase
MRFENKTLTKIGFAGIALCLLFSLGKVPFAFAQQGGFFQQSADSRVQMRSYRFKDTGEKIQYALFVSSKAKKKNKNPLIMLLHGWGGGPASFMFGNILKLAQEEGYILVGPAGYIPQAAFGAPVVAGRGALRGPTAADSPNLDELSEKDAMNVLEIVRNEFNVDESRMYLIGISTGGAGAFHLGVKYASNWAAIAAIAPADFFMQPSMFAPVKDTMPVIVVQGDSDTIVPAANTRRWIAEMKEMKMKYQYLEMQGGDHGNVLAPAMPHIFAFFKQHSKPASQ